MIHPHGSYTDNCVEKSVQSGSTDGGPKVSDFEKPLIAKTGCTTQAVS